MSQQSAQCASVLTHLPTQFEVEGTFESGILAASWNPDESVVAIVTGGPIYFGLKHVLSTVHLAGERKLIILTSTFDVLSERPIYVEEFGEGTFLVAPSPYVAHTPR